MSKWIKNRRPTAQDADDDNLVWRKWCGQNQKYPWWHVRDKEAWRKIDKPEPYVAPKPKYYVRFWPSEQSGEQNRWCVYCNVGGIQADNLPTREAAERVAAIYNEVMP